MIAVVALVGCRTAKPTSDPNAVGDQGATNKPTNKPLPEDFDSLKALAEQGVAKAQYNLGNMYRKGQGVERDLKKAFKWAQKAAAQGNAGAQHQLGYFYDRLGHAIRRDNVAAYAWYSIALANGDKESKVYLNGGLGITKNMTTDQIA